MEVDTTTPAKTTDKLCNGSSNEDMDAEITKEKVQNGTKKVNGVHNDEDMEVDEEQNGVEDTKEDTDDKELNDKVLDKNDESKKSKLENGDSHSSEDLNDSVKEIEDTDTADDSVQVLDSSNVQDVSNSSDVQTVSSETSKDKDEESVMEVDDKEEAKGQGENVEEKEDKSEEIDKSKEGDNDQEKDKDSETKADKGEAKSSEKDETEKDKEKDDDKDKSEGDKDKDKGKPEGDKDKEKDKPDGDKDKDKSEGNKDKDKDVEAVDLTDDKDKADTPKPTSSKARINAALKPPSASAQMRPMASLLFDLGMDLARQQVYKDLIRIQQKKQSMDKLDEKETRQLDKLKEAYDDLVAKNSPYSTDTGPCDQCEFKADVETVLENHKEYGHVNEQGIIKCSYCEDQFKVGQQFIMHMDQKHKRKGRVIVRHSFFVCPYCPFEHNSKASFNKHILRCERVFNLLRNLEPTPADCDIPIKLPKPPAVFCSEAQTSDSGSTTGCCGGCEKQDTNPSREANSPSTAKAYPKYLSCPGCTDGPTRCCHFWCCCTWSWWCSRGYSYSPSRGSDGTGRQSVVPYGQPEWSAIPYSSTSRYQCPNEWYHNISTTTPIPSACTCSEKFANSSRTKQEQ